MELLTGPNLAALLTLPGVGEKRAVTLATHYGTWDRLLAATPDELADRLGAKTGGQVAKAMPTAPLVATMPPGARVVSIHDDHYPARLRDLTDAPTLLWWTGTLPTNDPMLAVVGTRTPNAFGASVARHAATQAAEHGIATVSGLALGVDSLAHEASLDAGVPTWAVLGQGIDTLPKSGDRADLAARILANGGGLLSEVQPGTPVAGHILVRRNRLQSGLSVATFIAQTGLASGPKPAGTLHTARFALEQGRYLAVAVPPTNLSDSPDMAGNAALTSPYGTPAETLHATDPTTVATINARTPVADLCVGQASDFAVLWEHLNAGERTGPVS